MTRWPLPSIALLAVLSASPLAGQAQPAVEPGSRVRLSLLPDQLVDHRDAQELRGTVLSLGPDTLVVRLHSTIDPVSIPLAWVERLDVSQGRASAWRGAREGAWSGLLVGAGIGAFVGAEVARETNADFVSTVLTRAAAYGISLSVTGAVGRALAPGEVWRRVRIDGVSPRSATPAPR